MPHQDHKILYTKLVENMNEAVWVGDSDERTVYANPRFCEILEYSLEEILGKQSYEFWDEESAKRVKWVNANHRKKGLDSSYEGNLLTKSGKLIPVLINGSSINDGGTIGIMTDLRSLKQQETVYKKLVEHMNEAVWMGDKNERTVYANPKFCEIMEYTLDEMLGRKSYDFWDQESARKVEEVNNRKRAKGISSSYEGVLKSKTGKLTPVFLSGTPLPDGGTIGIMTDLSKLKHQESLYQSLIENMNEAVWMGDKNERTIYVNPKFCDLTGYSADEVIGKDSYFFWDQESIEMVKSENIKRINGQTSSYEGNLLTKDGKKIPVLVNGAPLPAWGTVGIITDLTELKEKKILEQVNEKLEEANKKLIELDKMKSDFISIVSHELRTPLTIIQGHTSMILEDYRDEISDDVAEQISYILESSRKLISLTNDTLDIMKLESGMMNLSIEKIKFKHFLKEVIKDFALLYKNKNIVLKLNCRLKDNILLNTDEKRLKQIFTNLLSNAYKFTPESGMVEIGVKKEKNANYYLCYVSDNGIGIPKDQHSLVFKKFQQVNNPIQKYCKGTGLGMSIVKEIVKVLGGEIWFESKPRKGTIFYFTIKAVL